MVKLLKIPGVRSTNKYGNIKSKRILPDGTEVKCDSLLETRMFDKLFDKEYQEEYGIDNVKFQVRFPIIDKYSLNGIQFIKKKGGKGIEFKEGKINTVGNDYIADFVITLKNGIELIVDAKGVETDVFKIKKKLFEQRYGVQLINVKKEVLDKGYFDEYLLKLKLCQK